MSTGRAWQKEKIHKLLFAINIWLPYCYNANKLSSMPYAIAKWFFIWFFHGISSVKFRDICNFPVIKSFFVPNSWWSSGCFELMPSELMLVFTHPSDNKWLHSSQLPRFPITRHLGPIKIVQMDRWLYFVMYTIHIIFDVCLNVVVNLMWAGRKHWMVKHCSAVMDFGDVLWKLSWDHMYQKFVLLVHAN